MAVGDAVILRRSNDDPRAPLIGIVNVEPGGDLAAVLWRNGNYTAGIPFAQLQKVFIGDELAVSMVGKWAQIISYNENDPDGGEGGVPKSPAAAGLVLDAFGLADYDEEEAVTFWVIVSTEDGRGSILCRATVDPETNVLSIHPGRRNV